MKDVALLVSNLGRGYACNSEPGFRFCPGFYPAGSHSLLSKRTVGGRRERSKVNLSRPFPVSSSGEGLGKKAQLRLRCNSGILHEFQMSTFSLSSISKKHPTLAVLLSKITQSIQGISAELPYQ